MFDIAFEDPSKIVGKLWKVTMIDFEVTKPLGKSIFKVKVDSSSWSGLSGLPEDWDLIVSDEFTKEEV